MVLGVFVSTYLYCLLVIQATKSFAEQAFVPGMSVYVGVILAFVSVAVLIYFIHHVARSIQADYVINNVYCELRISIDRLFPNSKEEAEIAEIQTKQYQQTYLNRHEVMAGKSGYVQALEIDLMVSLGQKHDMVFEVLHMPGDFVIQNTPVLVVFHHSTELPLTDQKLLQMVLQGSQRTPVQDPEFAIHQLVEIAVRALSPGINDPYSAITCVDKLSAILCELSERPFPQSNKYDDNGAIRVTTNAIKYSGLAEAAFNQIRQYSKDSIAVTIRLLESLDNLALASINDEQNEFVYLQLQMIEEVQGGQPLPKGDQSDIAQRIKKIRETLSKPLISDKVPPISW